MRAVTIYVLFDRLYPGRIRYVGQTLDYGHRIWRHRHPSPNSRGPVVAWAREIGERLDSIKVAEVPADDADQAEQDWIARMRAEGHSLLNVLDGGRSGYRGTEAFSAALRAAPRPDRQKGETHHAHRLTEEAVGEIRRLLLTDMPIVEIAAQYGVARQTINAIRDGRSWKHRDDAALAVEGGRRYRRRGES